MLVIIIITMLTMCKLVHKVTRCAKPSIITHPSILPSMLTLHTSLISRALLGGRGRDFGEGEKSACGREQRERECRRI